MKKFLSTHFPAVNDIVLAFAFTAFLVYGRSIYVFIWSFPSWLKLLTTGEILIILSYTFVFSLVETVGIVLVLSIIGAILPAAWFRNSFAVCGVWAVFVCLGSLLVFFGLFDILILHLIRVLPIWSAATAVLVLLAVIVAPRLRFMRVAALWFSDRTIVFLYLFAPASTIGLIVITIRLIMIYIGFGA